MNPVHSTIACASLLFAFGAAHAQDAMKKDDMSKDGAMTMRQCKDHMAMSKKDGMKKDDAMMKKDTACAEMMKNEMPKDAMKKDGMAKESMKK